MCNTMYNGIKCNDAYLQRCFNHLILLRFIGKVKISEFNYIFCGCSKNNTRYGILEKKLRDIRNRKNLDRILGLRSPICQAPKIDLLRV